ESTPAAERDELHRQAARLLYENGHPAEAVAARLLAAPGVRESWAPDVLRSAAAQARRRHAPERAARYLRRALLDSTAGGQDRARLLVDLAATEREFDPAAAGRHVAEAVPLLASAAERAVALTQISPMSLATTPPGEPELLEAVMHELDSDGSELALRLEARSRHARNVDATALADNVERFRAIAHDPPLGTAAGRELCAVLAHSAMLSGCLPATDVARVANGILAAEPAVPAHVHGGVPLAVISLVAADSVAVAGPWLDWALEQAESRGAKLAVALTEASHAFLLLGTGALGEAKDHALRAFELSLGWREATIRATIALCQVTSATREPELMRELLECDRVQPGDSLALDAARDLLRCSEAAARDPRAALDHALTCGRRLERAGWAGSPHFPWRTAAVTLHKWLGNIEAGKALAEEEYEQALVWGAPTMLSRALRLRGDLVPGDKGLALLEESVEVAEASVNRLEQARALIMLGTRLREAGAASAAERLRRGRELAQPCGADWLTWHDEVNQPTGLLTPTELKVASMAAQGRTNADIAADLGVSSRAIEKHLSKCYRKLDISGKAELRAVLKLSDPH
ncbi:MAG TPA: LuxR C-terminal-related transcriptional regulator, partial [Amycolatopsis sp.]|nr:LuxR C-terminal-related transcriptional regulator [Amycolatopsis sp.]